MNLMNRRMQHTGLVMAMAVVLVVAWSANALALEKRIGSLEFGYTSPPDPIGVVILNHVSDARPSIAYQIPPNPKGSFTTPWGMVIQSGEVTSDTLIMLTNPDGAATLTINVSLRDRDGVVGTNCARTLVVGPERTVLRSSRTLFSGCASVTP